MKSYISAIILLFTLAYLNQSCQRSESAVANFDILRINYIQLDDEQGENQIRVLFQNQSSGGISYQWDFGDGNIQNVFEPDSSFHVYKQGGTYNVTLTVMGNEGPVSITKTVTIDDLVPRFDIEADPNNFNRVIINTPRFDTLGNVLYNWDYGDGESSTTQDSVHVYWFKNGGDQQVTLRLTRGNEVREVTKSISLPTLRSDFWIRQNPTNLNEVTFTNISENILNIDSTREGKVSPEDIKVRYQWNFGNGRDSIYVIPDDFKKAPDSIQINYVEGGNYPVTLTITQGNESRTVTKSVVVPNIELNFTTAQNNASNPNEVTFIPTINNTVGASFFWSFGDGTTLSVPDDAPPTHIYTNGGIFVVQLTVTRGTETRQVARTVNLPVLGVDFSFTLNPSNPKFVTFQPNLINDANIESLTWSLGDGNIEIKNNQLGFAHTYTTGGTYPVQLSVKQGSEVVSITKTVIIPSLKAAFSPNVSASNFYLISFINQSENSALASFLWDFGDGTTSNAFSPSHTYKIGGVYEVTLTVTEGSEVSNVSQTISVPILAPNFQFNVNNFQVSFDARSSENTLASATYEWNFGDGMISTEMNPTHNYTSSGSFDVILKITQGPETKTISKTIIISPIVPDFDFEIPTGCVAPCTVIFTNKSQNVPLGATYEWSFGDGQTSNLESPAHDYNASSLFSVTMTIRFDGRDFPVSKIVNVRLVDASFIVSGGNCESPCTVNLQNTSENVPANFTSWWDYGTGSGFVQNNNPVHNSAVYNTNGLFVIKLQIRDAMGTPVNETTRSVTISAPDQSVDLLLGLDAFYPFTNTIANVAGSTSPTMGSGAVSYFVDRKGNANSAFEFDNSRYIETNRSLPFNSSQLAFSFWMRPRSDYGGTGDVLDNSSIYIGYDNFDLVVRGGAGENRYDITASFAWHHFVINMDSSGNITVYENGSVLNRSAGVGTWSGTSNNPANVDIGRRKSVPRNEFDGWLDDIRIYGRILNPSEVSALYNE